MLQTATLWPFSNRKIPQKLPNIIIALFYNTRWNNVKFIHINIITKYNKNNSKIMLSMHQKMHHLNWYATTVLIKVNNNHFSCQSSDDKNSPTFSVHQSKSLFTALCELTQRSVSYENYNSILAASVSATSNEMFDMFRVTAEDMLILLLLVELKLTLVKFSAVKCWPTDEIRP